MVRIILNISTKRILSDLGRVFILLTFAALPFSANAQNTLDTKIFNWVNHRDQVKVLDSLIHEAPLLALKPADYNHGYLEKLLNKRETLLNNRDSLIADSLINRIAILFFSDLAYGNQLPSLQSVGYSFKQNSYNITTLLNKHLLTNTLPQLVNHFNNNSKEVSTLLVTLKIYQDSIKKYPSRIKHIINATNNYRWLRGASEAQRVVLVNIPSAQLKVYEREKIMLFMKLILGKARTPSQTFSSVIKKITINPYWVVPSSIAINEMLPKLKRDNGYLERNNLQVLNSRYIKINPNGINWNNYDASNFPFTIRQSTGCDNSLGIIKLEFDSPFGVYLHDTPEKSLFKNNSRFYSHGCMRMEKPIEMAKLLMQKNSKALDSIDLEACASRPNPITITVPIPTPLIVWYNLVDFDSTGKIKFYKDIYHRFTH